MMGPWLVFAALLNGAAIALFQGSPLGRDFGVFVQAAGVSMLGLVPSIAKAWRASDCMKVRAAPAWTSPLHHLFYCLGIDVVALLGACPDIQGKSQLAGAMAIPSLEHGYSPSPSLCGVCGQSKHI